MNNNKNRILKIINKNPGITFNQIKEFTEFSKSKVYYHVKSLEDKKLIVKYSNENNKNNYRYHPTKLGKEIYLQNKVKLLLDKNILCEVGSLAPCLCDGCIFFCDNLIEFCDSVKCNSNKIYVINKTNKKSS